MKVLIIEDENLIARELQDKINTVAPDVKTLAHLTSLKTARRWFMQNAEPDLLFMDIQLGDGVSFELFKEFDITCPVIFTTAYDEYAIRAFKVNSIDYLLKPIKGNELAAAIEKARRLQQTAHPPLGNMLDFINDLQRKGHSLYKEKFIVNMRNQWMPVKTSDIACFIRDNLNYLYTFSGEKYILDFSTLEEIEDLLDPRMFYRANRQFIIHIESIHSIKPDINQKLRIQLKTPLKFEVEMSREKAPVFKKWIDR